MLFRRLSNALRTIFIQTETTPNDNAIKFLPGKVFKLPSGRQTLEFTSRQSAMRSPLADAIFKQPGVQSVMIGKDWVAVTKDATSPWSHLKPAIFAAIMDHFTLGQELTFEEVETSNPESDPVVKMIREVLDTRVRPAIQADGGDLEYLGWDAETGHVRLRLQGACRTCSSSTITLRNGIERMLMYYVPEVRGVEQVEDEYFNQLEKEKYGEEK